VPTVVAATCALTFAWIVVAPWQLPWYSSIAWVTLALLPRNSLTRWLTIATGTLAMLHFNGGHPTNVRAARHRRFSGDSRRLDPRHGCQ
jgi:hypothetical protein